MRYLRIVMVGYIGIYNGLGGVDKIDISFPITGNKIVGIKGLNGTGKSTVFNALQPFPDPASSFVHGMNASKHLEIMNNGITYIIDILHDVKPNGDRATAKAYIKKFTIKGEYEEMNPNGNISSYKEYLSEEFGLDPCCLALTRIASYDRGLADKKPAERKKYVNELLGQLITYNEINKVLTKRASVFRSFVNSLTVKIDNIGNEEGLKNTLATLTSQCMILEQEKDNLISEISYAKSKISLKDPNGTIQADYDDIFNTLKQLKGDQISLSDKIKNILTSLGIAEQVDIDTLLSKYMNLSNQLSTDIMVIESNISNLILSRENEAKELNNKQAKLESIQLDNVEDDIENRINQLRTERESYVDYIGDTDGMLKSSDYESIISALNIILNQFNVFKSEFGEDVVHAVLEDRSIRVVDQEHKFTINQQFNAMKAQYDTLSSKLDLLESLEKRPSECMIDSCPFVSKSVEFLKTEPMDKINELQLILNELQDEIQTIDKMENSYAEINRCIASFNTLDRTVVSYTDIIQRCGLRFSAYDLFTTINLNDIIRELDSKYQKAVAIESLNNIDNVLYRLESDYKVYVARNELVNDLISDINLLNDKISEITLELDSSNDRLCGMKEDMVRTTQIISNLQNLKAEQDKLNQINAMHKQTIDRYLAIESDIKDIKACKEDILNLEVRKNNIINQLNPISKQIDDINHKLKMTESYRAELEVMKIKYEKVQTLKYYSSPTTGIQLIFMDLYMNKTIELANDLLKLMFNGQYVICNFEIDADGFKIPIIGKGLRVDDISSCSTSEICMIGLILSGSLLYQSSTSFNVLMWDEIDSGLDATNRRQFMELSERMMNILNIEQCFIITHNNEYSMDNMDLVIISKDGTEDFSGANIIHDQTLVR